MRRTEAVEGIRLSLWRALVLFRVIALAICLVLILKWQPIYQRAGIAAGAGAAMTLWTALLAVPAVRGRAHRLTFVMADVVVTAGLTLLTIPAQTTGQHHTMVTLTTIWAAGPTIAAAFVAGPFGGLVAAAAQYGVSAFVADQWTGRTLYSGVLLILTGGVLGVVTRLATRAEQQLHAAAAVRAALAERERLTRSIHDGALQVLGLVHRKGAEAGGEWAALAAEAGEQEAALRSLLTTSPAAAGAGDLAGELRALRSATVTVSTPAAEVPVPAATAAEIRDAVRAALQNVSAHAGDGARAWVLLETLDDAVRVTVRDDGAGFEADRLAHAESDGRVGVARSIRGRIIDLGGRCTITSTPGEGTEIEMIVPW